MLKESDKKPFPESKQVDFIEYKLTFSFIYYFRLLFNYKIHVNLCVAHGLYSMSKPAPFLKIVLLFASKTGNEYTVINIITMLLYIQFQTI
jgi:hypothetical protein